MLVPMCMCKYIVKSEKNGVYIVNNYELIIWTYKVHKNLTSERITTMLLWWVVISQITTKKCTHRLLLFIHILCNFYLEYEIMHL